MKADMGEPTNPGNKRRGRNMPWKDPAFWRVEFFAPLLASLTAVLRIVYDDRETRVIRVLLEAGICGLLTVAASAGIEALGLHQKWSMFAGGVIGFMGADYIRFVAHDFIQSRKYAQSASSDYQETRGRGKYRGGGK